MANTNKLDPDEIRSALAQKNGIICVFTEDGRRHYVRGYDYHIHKLSKCSEILRSDDGTDIYEDIDGANCLQLRYYDFRRHPSLAPVPETVAI